MSQIFKRKQGPGQRIGKSSPLPVDFIKMVNEVLNSNFAEGLQAVSDAKGAASRFSSSGAIFPDEILLSVSLMHEGSIAATTVHASADFDPKASSPNAQDLLGACVDSVGAIFALMLDPKNKEIIEAVANESLGSLENLPFEWSEVELDRFKIWVVVDKSNPDLEAMTEDWLEKNDPEAKKNKDEEQSQTEKLFVTGASAKKPGGGNTIH